MNHLDDLEDRNSTMTNTAHNRGLGGTSSISRLSELQRKKEFLIQKLQRIKEVEDQLGAKIQKKNEQVSENGDKAEIERYLQELKNTLECYRLLGMSVFSVDRDRIIVSLDTSYKNRFYESYYIELQVDRENLRMTKHSLPSFIPVLEIESQYLQSDTHEFLFAISNYLQSYIARREEVQAIKDIDTGTTIRAEVTEPLDYVEIKIGDDQSKLCLEYHMTYDDILSILPSKVGIHCYTDEEVRQPDKEDLKSWKRLLQTECMSVAVRQILKDYNKIK